MIKWLLGALLLIAPSLALAQSQNSGIRASGSFAPGHTVRCQNSTCTVVVDGGGSAGSSINGQGYLTEIGITNTGTPLCINDALTSAAGGYHQFCLGANALGGGLISYNAVGGASPLGLTFNINGTSYAFPVSGSGNVVGPNSTGVGHLAVWNSTLGTLLSDSPNLNLSPTLVYTATPFSPAFTSTYMQTTASGVFSTGNTKILPVGYDMPMNYFQCSDTATAAGGSQNNPLILDCVTIYMTNVGSGTGDRDGLNINMSINGSTPQTEGNAYFNGGIATIVASSNLGGTNLGAQAAGDVYGWSTQLHLVSGATNYASVHGAGEWDLDVAAGASVANKFGAQIHLGATDAVQGANIDAALLLSSDGSVGWKNLIQLGFPPGQGGNFPLAATGTILGSYAGGAAAEGIDFGNITFSDCAIRTTLSCLTNNGLVVGKQSLSTNVTLQVHTGTNQNLAVTAHGDLSDGVQIGSFNDAFNAFLGLELQGSTIELNSTTTSVTGGGLVVGTPVLSSGVVLQVHTGANQNLAVSAHGIDLTDGVQIGSFNDAFNAFLGLELQGSTIRLNTSTQTLIVGTLNLGGLSGAGSASFYVCADINSKVLLQAGPC